MRSAKNVGRIVGVLFLAQAALAPVVHFRLLRPVTARDFLPSAAGSALQIGVAVLLSLLLGALTLAIAIAATPVFRRYSESLALSFLALGVLAVATLAVESIAIRNMLWLSQEYATVGPPNEVLQLVGRAARATWVSAHFTNLLVAHIWAFVLHATLFRSALVPRALAVLGMASAVVSIAGVTMPLLGYRFLFLMLMPVGVSQLALIAWLIVRGFEERRPPLRDDAERMPLARSVV